MKIGLRERSDEELRDCLPGGTKLLRKVLKDEVARIFGTGMVDRSVRYYPVVEVLRKKGLAGRKILEVGSGARGITDFLPVRITGVDVTFDDASPLVRQVKASAVKLPFKNSSFDAAISVDTLEHLSAGDRVKAVKEMLRVARGWVIIHIPCDAAAFAQDRDLWLAHKRIFQKDHPALGEHMKHGVPETSEILRQLTESSKSLKKRISVEVKPTLNLRAREYLMRSWITKSFFLHVLDRTVNVLLIPVFAKLNFGSCYRRLFIVKII